MLSMIKEMHSTCLLDLRDTNIVFWSETLNVNIIVLVSKKTPLGTFKLVVIFIYRQINS